MEAGIGQTKIHSCGNIARWNWNIINEKHRYLKLIENVESPEEFE